MGMKKAILGKKTIIGALAVLALAGIFCVATKGDKDVTLYACSATDDMQDMALEESYEAYLEENGYTGTMSDSEIEIDLNNYETAGELTAEVGENGLITEGDGSITWTFNVASEGFYNLELGYIALPGTTSDIQREILIDGEILYDDLSSLVIRRWWADEDIEIKNGNELRPNSYEVYEELKWFVEDAERRSGSALIFYLSKGQHTLTFNTIKEPLEYTSLTFVAEEEKESYETAVAALQAEYEEYSGDTIVLQAERCEGDTEGIKKNSVSLSVQKNHSDSLVYPYHAYYNRYNTIGGESWENPGDAITWTINVEQEGLYEIAFKGRQNTNRGVTSYRRLYVNGEVPYVEAEAIGFEYTTEMNQYVVADNEGTPMLFYLHEGSNDITLENVMGPFGAIVTEVEASLKVLNSSYLHVIQLTGKSPDIYIDYQIAEKVPDFKENMEAEADRLDQIVEKIVEITGEKGENTALLSKMAVEARNLAKDPESVTSELSQLKNNISAVGTWLVQVSAMPLEMDSLSISAKGAELPDTTDSFWQSLCNGTLRFFASFFIDSSSVGESEGAGTETLTVWVASYGKEQAQIIQNLVDNSFSSKTDIPVKIQLIPADVVLRAALAGNGPDVVIGLSQSTLQDFAMRDATVDLSTMEGYSEVASVFPESALGTASYNGGVYGLPETANFLMMFYRQDIFNELGISAPTTWEEFIEIIPVLQQHNYGAYIPNAYLNDGSGNLNFFQALVFQYGGNIYNGEETDYGISSALSDKTAMEAFKDYTDLYTNYGLDVQVDFSNRFRTGEIPIGITNYTTFCQLEIFAPEIKGQWSFAPIPGTVKEDGTVDNMVLVDTVDTVIMKQTDSLDEAWEFMKWWMSTDTQLEYCQSVESVMGTAARIASANPEVIEQLPWSNSELKAILSQYSNSKGLPAVPGYYMTSRMISYAFADVISNNANPRESLYLNTESINKELTRKRSELE